LGTKSGSTSFDSRIDFNTQIHIELIFTWMYSNTTHFYQESIYSKSIVVKAEPNILII